MAKEKFNLTQLLTQRSIEATQEETLPNTAEKAVEDTQTGPATEMQTTADIYDLIPSKGNFYGVEDVEDLKQSIELMGVLQPLLVTPQQKDGKRRIVAGHRRRLAVMQLVEEGKDQFRYVPILEREEKVHNNSYESLVDESRDVSEQLKLLHKNKNFYAGVKSEQGGPASKIPASTAMLAPAECAAYVKVFGSVKNGIEMYLRKRKLDQANKNKPEKEKKHDRSLERKFENVRMYMKALEYNEVRKGITQEDTDFAFQTLVEGQKDVQTKDDTNIAGLYQALAYEKVFGGMKIWLSNAAAQHTDMQMLLNEDVTDYLSDKVKGNGKDAFRMILSSVKKSLGDQANDEEIYQRFVETFEKTYLDRVLRSILDPKQEDASAQKNITGYFNMMKDGSSGNMEAFKESVLSIIAKL